jgi:tRNA threonylcarbamoyladenosine biosynthesis protein TsaE
MSGGFHLRDTAQTERLGQAMADTRPARAVLFLQGDLGAGKSTLARALLRRLGVRGAIRSPTYTLVERHALDTGEAVHLDLYRLAAAEELDFLGLDELAAQAALWLVEWPDRGGAHLPRADVTLALTMSAEGRQASLVAGTVEGEGWLARLNEIAVSRGLS